MLTSLSNRWPALQGLINFVYPPLCSGCGAYCEDEEAVCGDCLRRIQWIDSPLPLSDIDFRPDSVARDNGVTTFPLFAAGDYNDPLKQIVINFKFKGVLASAKKVAAELVRLHGVDLRKLAPAILVPIPLHPSREYTRGYNQAAVLARLLGKRLDMPVDESILYRIKKKRPQARLKKNQRSANIRSVFQVSRAPDEIDLSDRILLVDDVVTSGQTMFEARRCLSGAGFRVIGGLAMAHAI